MLLSELFAGLGEVRRDCEVSGLAFLPRHPPGSVVPLYDREFVPRLDGNVAAVVTVESLAKDLPSRLGVVVSANPLEALWQADARIDERGGYWADFESQIDDTAHVSPRAHVASRNVVIGAGTLIEPGAVIQERVTLGKRCKVRSGAVLGSEGFEVRTIGGHPTVVPHSGGVEVGDDVEIMANTCVAKALLGGSTRIGDGTKIDALIHVAHNVQIGREVRIAAQAMLGGSSHIGDNCWIGPSASISNSIAVGAGARVTMGAVVTRDVAPGEHVTGNFAIPHERFLAFLKSIR